MARSIRGGGDAGQRIFVVRREDYVYLVPSVEDGHSVFLKTIIPGARAAADKRLRETPWLVCGTANGLGRRRRKK